MNEKHAQLFENTPLSHDSATGTRPAAAYAGFFRHAIRQLDLEPGEKALDVHAGMGSSIELLAGHVGEEGAVVSIEFSRGMVKLTEKRSDEPGSVSCLHGDITDVVGYASSFDRALISFCLCSMRLPRRRRVLEHVGRMLKDGGTLVILDHYRALGEKDMSSREPEPRVDSGLSCELAQLGYVRIEYIPLLNESLLLLKATRGAM